MLGLARLDKTYILGNFLAFLVSKNWSGYASNAIINLMPNWKIEYCETSSGRLPALEFVESLPLEAQGRIRNAFRLLEEFGPKVGLPHLKSIKNYKPLNEIRILGETSVRLICVLEKWTFYILHGFKKEKPANP